jgi:hypothetical protein
MDRFLDSELFPFIVVIAIVAFRIVSMARRQKRKRQRQESAPASAPSPAPVPVAQAMPADDEEETFSAWNLSVNDDPPAPVPAAPRRVRETLPRFLETPPLVPEAPQHIPEASPRFLAEPRVPAAPSGFPETPAPDRAASTRPAKKPARRLSGLSPLQQGVVWAEILGKPKGF